MKSEERKNRVYQASSQLKEQMEESKRLDEEIKKNLEGIGFRI